MMIENFLRLLGDIRQGECRSRNLSNRLLVSEDGLITWATLVAVLLLIALIGIVFNVGRVSNDKLQSQNAADSVAYSSSLVHARAMNAVTATNHMMGELTALHTMHHAIGGQVLDQKGSKNNLVVTFLNLAIDSTHFLASVSYWAVRFLPAASFSEPFPGKNPGPPESFGPAKQIPRGEATVYDSQCLLKSKFPSHYLMYAQGSLDIGRGIPKTWIFFPPWVRKAGWAQIRTGQLKRRTANAAIRELVREYRFIIKLEDFALGTLGAKRSIPKLTDGLWAYEQLIVKGTPLTVKQVASQTAEANGCVGEALGRPTSKNIAISQTGLPVAGLPLIQDPCGTTEKTQLMRATYPWVQEWRWPILLAFGGVVPQSRAMIFYEYHSDRYSKETTRKFVNDRGYRLYVIEELNAAIGARDKGTETWRRRAFSRKADQMFAIVGIARKENPPAMSLHRFFIPVANETPIATVAQAMIYQANEPKRWKPSFFDIISSILKRRAQPVQAWDTLAWTEGATEWKDGKPYFEWAFFIPRDLKWTLGIVPYPPDLSPPTPKLRLNWQAKLSPVSAGNLSMRILMTRDAELRKRMREQVLPTTLAEQAGVDLITH